ncbi:MAG: phosphate signaling complex protein PhoU [Proteobacteria bacterium]|nr:phosphate signaling complex protein PhoU [Pseudomonadota bacterium]
MAGQRDDFTQHFSSQFNKELENLRNRVLAMGAVVEQQIADAVTALETGNANMARAVIGGDLHVNALEVYLDEECGRILARRQPAAGDLRLVFAVIKTVTDIERIGDSAKGVARMAIKMIEAAPQRSVLKLQPLGDLVREMVHQALSAFAHLDVNLALQVERADIPADLEYQSIMRRLTTQMTEEPGTINWALHLVWAARALERAGDHAKNISEYLIYMVQGKDVRHVSIEDRERQVQDRASLSSGEANEPSRKT